MDRTPAAPAEALPSWATDPRWRWAALAASAVGLIAVLIWALGQPLPELPSTGPELAALGGAVAAYFLSLVVRGERVRRFVAQTGGDLSHADAFGTTAVSFALNAVIPARAGDVARIGMTAQRGGIGLARATGVLITERLLDAAVLLGLFAVLAYGVLSGIDAPAFATVVIPALLLAVVVAAIFLIFRPQRSGRLGRISRAISPAIEAARSLRGRFAIAMTALTLGIWLAEGLTYLAVSGAVGIEISPLEALYIIAVAGVFVLIPSGPGYLGTLDAAVVFALRAIGASGRATVSYLVTLRLVLFVPVVIAGSILLATRYGGIEALRSQSWSKSRS